MNPTTHKEAAEAIGALETSPAGRTIAGLLRREIDGGLGKEYPAAALELAGRCQVAHLLAANDRVRALLAEDLDNRTMRNYFMLTARRLRAAQRLETKYQGYSWERILRG